MRVEGHRKPAFIIFRELFCPVSEEFRSDSELSQTRGMKMGFLDTTADPGIAVFYNVIHAVGKDAPNRRDDVIS